MIAYILEVLKITIPASVSVGIVMLARYYEKQRETEAEIRKQKIKIYEKFVNDAVNFLIKSPNSSDKKRNQLQADLVKTFEEFHKNIMFWGSNDIINAYNTYRYRFEMQDAKMEDFDIKAIYRYLRTVPAVNHHVDKYPPEK